MIEGSLCKSFAIAAGFALGMAGLLSGQYTYSTFTIPEAAPATQGSLAANGINNAGDTSGYLTDSSGNLKGWVRNTTGGVLYLVDPLDTTTPTYSPAYKINDYGNVVGIFNDTAAASYPGYLYNVTNRTYYTINLPGEPAGSFTFVEGLNDHDQICGGVAAPPTYVYQAFLDLSGTTIIVPLPSNTGAYCGAINDYGVAVGWYTDSNGVNHGWVRNPSTGTVTTFNAPGASTVTGPVNCVGTSAGTIPYGINDSEEISGHFFDASNQEHGFVISGGTFTQLDVPGAIQTGGGGVNASGQVVGHYVTDSACDNAVFIASPGPIGSPRQ
jgi:uncharacterized membrane protein